MLNTTTNRVMLKSKKHCLYHISMYHENLKKETMLDLEEPIKGIRSFEALCFQTKLFQTFKIPQLTPLTLLAEFWVKHFCKQYLFEMR